jgi:hypothetical protein
MLININHSFYSAIKTAIVCCNLTFRGSSLREHVGSFLRENIASLCYDNISKIQNGYTTALNAKIQHTTFATMNRTLTHRETVDYVQDKIPA